MILVSTSGERTIRLRSGRVVMLLLCSALWTSSGTYAWTKNSQQAIAEQAKAVVPPDLARQIEKHQAAFRTGVERGASLGSGSVGTLIEREAQRAVAMIQQHVPFADVIEQMGKISYWVAYANNPYHAGGRTPNYTDYLGYVDSARNRFRPVFYGLIPQLESGSGLATVVKGASARGRRYRTVLETEYRRVGGPPGARKFDDRSSAFGVSALAFSHAITDVGLALRDIWIDAGGADLRILPARGAQSGPTASAQTSAPSQSTAFSQINTISQTSASLEASEKLD